MVADIQWVSVCHTQTYLHKQTRLGDITVYGCVPSRGQDCTRQVRAATSVTPLLHTMWPERGGRKGETREGGGECKKGKVGGREPRGCREQLAGVNHVHECTNAMQLEKVT